MVTNNQDQTNVQSFLKRFPMKTAKSRFTCTMFASVSENWPPGWWHGISKTRTPLPTKIVNFHHELHRTVVRFMPFGASDWRRIKI